MRHVLVSAISLALAGVCTTYSASATADAAVAQPGATTRVMAPITTQLPRNVRPSHYDAWLTPHAATMTFDGKVGIAVEVTAPTLTITLNAVDMVFSKAQLFDADGGNLVATPSHSVDAEAQTVTFAFPKQVTPGKYRLALEYRGRIGTQANGLFAIDYDTSEGKKRALYTQFENSDARRMIPSWDEPAFKATFALGATVPTAQMAVSNMPVATREERPSGLVDVRFEQTPKMSTYLLFFALGDFERATATVDGTELGVVTQKGLVAQAGFALESAKEILREYNDYFGTPYPLPKLDNVASPGSSQFFGAMENWGAIYTFEYGLLLDPSISTQSDRQSIYSTNAHEMAHQWFGDLVTMQWWDDLWLNEGFASWMESRTTAKLHPEWNTALGAVGGRERAMGRDAVATTHPVVQHVETVEQASQAFDSITYSKGEAVIGMLESYVGADAWRAGVRSYMKVHAYGNTVSDDLWREVEAAAGKPITDIAHDFTLQPGVPMITVGEVTCKGGKSHVALTQSEFTKDRPDKQPLYWRVPVIAQASGSSEVARTVVAGGKGEIVVPGCGAVIVNAGQKGYYRTLYSPVHFGQLRDAFSTLAPIDQLGLLSDTWALGMSGARPASDYLDLAHATPVDADTQVWGSIAGTLYGLDQNYEGDMVRRERFRAFAIATLSPVMQRVGWIAVAGEAEPVTVLRSRLIGTLGALGDPAVVAEARRRYQAYPTDPQAMPAELRKTLLAVVARHADAATWDRIHTEAIVEKSPMVKDELYSLLSSTEDAALAKRALQLSLTDKPGETNAAGMVSGVSGLHPDLAFDFAVANREALNTKVDSTSRSAYYPGLGGSAANRMMIDKIRRFADVYIASGSRRAAETTIANIEHRIQVREKRLPEIDAWLEKHAANR